jgi:peptidyl-prolyl cis-trans isomerase D
MFDLFRSRAKAVRILLGALLVLVALSMVTYLIPGVGMNTGSGGMVVAEFGKETLTMPEVQRVIQAELRGQNIPPQMASVFVPQYVDQIITEYAMAYQAERMGFRVSEADLVNAIRQIIPQLFDGDKFVGREAYAAVLAQQNLTIPQFESAIRKQLLMDAMRRMVIESVAVSPQEIAQEFHYRNDKVKVDFVALSPVKYQSEVKVSPEEVQAYFNANRASFQMPERRSLDVLIVDEARLAQSVSVPEADLRRIYERNKDTYRVPERVHVRHILLKTTDAAKDQIAKIEAKAADLQKQLKAGADFAALAKKNSEDTASAEKGGDLSWIVRGQTVKAFEDTAFSLKPKEISGVIKTEYGFHILEVLEKQEAHLQSFEEVRAQLAEEQNKQLLFDRMQTISEQARAALVKDPASGAKIAADLGLMYVRAEKVGANDPIPQLGPSLEIMEAVGPLRKGEVTPVVQISPTRLAVAAVAEIQPSRQAELAEVESRIREQLSRSKLMSLLDQRANELAAKARSLNGDLRQAAQAMGLEYKSSKEFARDGGIDGLGPANYLSEAFRASVGEVMGPVAVNDLRAVYKVVAKLPASEDQLAAERETLAQQVRSSKSRSRLEIFEDSVKQRLLEEGKIKIHQDVISRLTSSYAGS